MAFVDTFDYVGFAGLPPARLYVHESVLSATSTKDPVASAERYFRVRLSGDADFFRKEFAFIVATAQRDESTERSLNIFGYSGVDPWPGDPEIYVLHYDHHELACGRPTDKALLSGDIVTMLWAEERARRDAISLADYFVRNERLLDVPWREIQG